MTRLIDAEALHDVVSRAWLTGGEKSVIKKLIDNAPTVPNEYMRGYEAAEREYKRPQGEWIIVKDERYGDNVKCPFCGKELAGTDLNFCCKCGAKLIGSEKMNGGQKNEHL